ncbi:MAG: endonuclease III [Bacilli bacterium]|nr:endonuclease III [Bacilli bacterium]
MKKIELIENYLEELFPNPKCEINYSKDYELLISVMLSAQTTDKRVNEVTKDLWNKYPTLEALKEADIEDLKTILRPLGNFNKKAVYTKGIATMIVDKYNGIMPRNRNKLEILPGVGRKTVNVVFSELNIEPQIAVDTHVERVSKRLKLAKENENVLEVEKHLRRIFKRVNWNKRHLQLVLFGRYYCKAISPMCESCRLKDICNHYKKEVQYDNRRKKK